MMRIDLFFLFFIMAFALLGCNAIASRTVDSAEPISGARWAVVPGGISDDKIVLGISAAFTGSSAGLGIENYRGAMAYFEQVNAKGAVILVGSYEACAGFIRDARDAGWDVPLANLSFVGSESLLSLLLKAGEAKVQDYTANLINSQVVPSYEDTILPAVREYRQLMDKHQPSPPAKAEGDYEPLPYSFVGSLAFLNAKLIVKLLTELGRKPQREDILSTMESFKQIDLGIKIPISFGKQKHQGLEQIYYMWVVNKRFVPIRDWQVSAK